MFSAPAVADGRLYIGMGVGDYINSAEVVRANTIKKLKDEGKSDEEIAELTKDIRPVGEVWCIDISKEKPDVIWKFPTERTVLGTVAVGEDRVFFGTRGGVFYGVSKDGAELGRFNARKPIFTSPALGRNHVYFMTEGGRVYGLNTETMEPVWEVGLGQGKLFMSSPALGNGHLYIGTDGNGIVCAGEPSDVVREKIWAGAGGDADRSAYAGGGLLPERGAYAWRFPSAGGDLPEVTAPLSCMDGAVYMATQSTQRQGVARIAYPEQDAPPGTTATQTWFFATALPVRRAAAVSSRGEAFVLDGRAGREGRALYCIDTSTGKERWRHAVAADADGTLRLTASALFVADRPGVLSCFGRVGDGTVSEPVWSAPVGDSPYGVSPAGDILLGVSTAEPAVWALDAAGGAELWRMPMARTAQTSVVAMRFEKRAEVPSAANPASNVVKTVTRDVVLVGQSDGLSGFDLIDGRELWTVDCGSVLAVTACGETLAACVTDDSNLVIVNVAAGREVARHEGALPALTPVFAGDTLLFGTESSIEKVDMSQPEEEPKRWLRTSWIGHFTSSPVGADSLIFFTTDKRGLVCARASKR